MTVQTAGDVPLSVVVAANVRAEAARRGMTQADVARAMGLSRMAVSDRYRGRTPWTLDELEAVSSRLRCPVSALLARPEGFEPPTFWFGAEGGTVVDLSSALTAA